MEVTDFVHGKFVVPTDICEIIKTPQFLRLKKIKQLGLLYKQVPEAETYTRYEHSLGTYYLASKMLTSLEKNSSTWFKSLTNNNNNSELELYKLFRKAVEIAALLHDIGHGPFSHLWERIVTDYNHEENAKTCVDDIFNSLQPDTLTEFKSNNNFGIELVKALILGESSSVSSCVPAKYNFIFEIVHNSQCELDVDKLDYLKHDYFFAKLCTDGLEDLGDKLDSIFFEARISENGHHIEYRYEDYGKIYELFQARHQLHVHFYRMPKVMACDYLLQQIITSEDFLIDGVPITKIRSNSGETFLKLVDNELLHIIRTHKLFPYLKNTERIVQAEKQLSQSDDPSVFEVRADIKGAGAEMPPDDKFSFYGKLELKTIINRDLKNKNLYGCFRLF